MDGLLAVRKSKHCYFKGLLVSVVVFSLSVMLTVDLINRGVLVDGLFYNQIIAENSRHLVAGELRKFLWPFHYGASIVLAITSLLISMVVDMVRSGWWSYVLFALSLFELANGAIMFLFDSPLAKDIHYLLIGPYFVSLYKTIGDWR